MIASNLIYFINVNRSHNWELHRELYYKVGYTYYPDSKNDITKGWHYRKSDIADLIFKETSAHEIGHQLLLEFGDRNHSYTHKGTSGPTWIQQDPLPETKYGNAKIDLMKYAEGSNPVDYFKRVILSKEDSLGLIWLSKLKIIGILCIIGLLCSCRFKDPKQIDKGEFTDYFNGIVLDEQHKPIENVKVTMYVVNQDNGSIDKEKATLDTFTDKNGYFRISDKTIDSLHIKTETRKLFFDKTGYKLDSASTNIGSSGYRPQYDSFDGLFFIFKVPDTITLHKNK
ncbi:carboxypeptidase-like regulatory domain-containing protein [Chryseobacterium sp. ERMR1:04]|uniref:carboxypeptidase-like regulatory domain-containing protein n=1 Tax=Chryseobacterium sp. ERMR1:04 TaxID=1705393 RepID=UPI0006CC8876|nr:carboxypeptidase-like regulatory domain-containing protein [Chryseobacterium sp. ERMR1:04]KPH13084.1 hypothetical protein AMQ68_11365 [Chryseobacterium sp. ERMR1:04]